MFRAKSGLGLPCTYYVICVLYFVTYALQYSLKGTFEKPACNRGDWVDDSDREGQYECAGQSLRIVCISRRLNVKVVWLHVGF